MGILRQHIILHILFICIACSVTIVSVSRDSVDKLGNINMLGDARDFLENFDWTNDALRDLQSVNINRTH